MCVEPGAGLHAVSGREARGLVRHHKACLLGEDSADRVCAVEPAEAPCRAQRADEDDHAIPRACVGANGRFGGLRIALLELRLVLAVLAGRGA